jgi:hypothetical protein
VLSALNAAGYRAIAVTNAKQRRVVAKNGTPGGAKDDGDQDVNNAFGEPSTVNYPFDGLALTAGTTELTD